MRKNNFFLFIIIFPLIGISLFPLNVIAYTWDDVPFPKSQWDGTGIWVSSDRMVSYTPFPHEPLLHKIEGDILYTMWAAPRGQDTPIGGGLTAFNLSQVNSGEISVNTLYLHSHTLLNSSQADQFTWISDFDSSGDKLITAGLDGNLTQRDNKLEFFEKQPNGTILSTANITFPEIDWRPVAVLINDDLVYTIDSKTAEFFVINATDWNNPYIMLNSNFTLNIDPFPFPWGGVKLYPRFLQKSANISVLYDGFKKILLFNITDPLNPFQISNSISLSAGVFDLRVQGNKLYAAQGQHGLSVYNLSDPTSPSLINKFSSYGGDLNAIVPYNDSALFVGDINGTISLLNTESEEKSVILEIPSCISLAIDLSTNLLVIGTESYGDQVYNISDPLNPQFLASTSEESYGGRKPEMGNPFDLSIILFNYFGGDPLTDWGQLYSNIHFLANDTDGKTHAFMSSINPNIILLYNDTNQDGILTLNVTRDEEATTMVTELGFADQIFAVPAFRANGTVFGEPQIIERDGLPAVYIEVTIKDYVMYTQPDDLVVDLLVGQFSRYPNVNWIPGVNKNITFDLTCGFWITQNEGNYSIKVDTIINDWNFSQLGELPSNLNLFLGSMTSLSKQTAPGGGWPKDVPLSSEVSNDTYAQEFGWEGGLIALSTMANNYTKTNQTGTYNLKTAKSAIIDYTDRNAQEIIGDSTHVYNWILGANFRIDNTTSSIEYDPELTLVTSLNFDNVAVVPIDSITITYPAGGEIWETGTNHTITWNSTGSIPNVKIELYLSGILDSVLTSGTLNDGDISWTIPSGLANSTQYQIKITDVSNSSTFDYSDYFEIYTLNDHDVSSPSISFGYFYIFPMLFGILLLALISNRKYQKQKI